MTQFQDTVYQVVHANDCYLESDVDFDDWYSDDEWYHEETAEWNNWEDGNVALVIEEPLTHISDREPSMWNYVVQVAHGCRASYRYDMYYGLGGFAHAVFSSRVVRR